MPALAHLPSGWILAVWQAAPDIEGEHRQHIRMSVSRDGKKWGDSWQLPVPKVGGGVRGTPGLNPACSLGFRV